MARHSFVLMSLVSIPNAVVISIRVRDSVPSIGFIISIPSVVTIIDVRTIFIITNSDSVIGWATTLVNGATTQKSNGQKDD